MKAFKFGLLCFVLLLLMPVPVALRAQGRGGLTQRDLLYVAVPGRVNDIGYGGIGILVFEANKNFRFVKRIPTWDYPASIAPEDVKGIAVRVPLNMIYKTVDQFGVGQLRAGAN